MWNEVPEGWKVQPLSKLCGEIIERVDPTVINGEVRGHYIGLEHIGQGTGQLDGVGSAVDVVSQKSRFYAGDILFGKLRPNLRKVAQPDFSGVCSTDIVVLRAKSTADPAFLFQVLQSEPLVAHAVATAAGTKMPRTHARSILSFEIAAPHLYEQRCIAEVLRSVDEALHAAYDVVEQCEQVLELELDSIVGKLLTDGVPQVKLGDVATVKGGKRLPKGSSYSNEPTSNPYIRVTDWRDYEIRTDDIRFISDEIAQSIWRYTISKSDLFISIAGSVGLVAGIPDELDGAYLTENAAKICISDPKLLNPTFLLAVLRSRVIAEQISKHKGVGGGVPKLALFRIEDLDIPLPDLSVQAQIALSYQSIREVAEAARTAVNQVKLVRRDVMSDLLSGRVRIPAQAAIATSEKAVPPAFKRAVFAAEIVHQLHNDNRFGSVKHEKIVHLCELHLGLQQDLDRHAYKEAAGPYDPKARRSVERIFQQQKWFDATKPDGNRVVYVPLEKAGGHAEYFDRYFGEQKPAIQSIVDLMRPLDTPQCEIVATLYAVWNDFLIDGQQPTDDEIVASVLQWHPKKQEIGEDRWSRALPWMRQKGLVPKGTGEKTRVAQA